MYLSLKKLLTDALAEHLPAEAAAPVGTGAPAITDEMILAQVVLLKLEMLRYASSSYEKAAKDMFVYLKKSSGVKQPLAPLSRTDVLAKLKSYRAAVKHGWMLPADAGVFIVTALGANPPSELATGLRKVLRTESKKMMDYYQRLCPGFATRPDAVVKFGIAPAWVGGISDAVKAAVKSDRLTVKKPSEGDLTPFATDWRTMAGLVGSVAGEGIPSTDEAWTGFSNSPVGRRLPLEMRLLLVRFLPQGAHNVWYECVTNFFTAMATSGICLMKEQASVPLDLKLIPASNGRSVVILNRSAWLANTGMGGMTADDAGLKPEDLIEDGAKSRFPVIELLTKVEIGVTTVTGTKQVYMEFSLEARATTAKLNALLDGMRSDYTAARIAHAVTLPQSRVRTDTSRRFGEGGRLQSFSLGRDNSTLYGSGSKGFGVRSASVAHIRHSKGGSRSDALTRLLNEQEEKAPTKCCCAVM